MPARISRPIEPRLDAAPRDRQHDRRRQQPERERPDRQQRDPLREREQDQDRAEAGAAGHADHVRRGERVGQRALQQRARDAERRADRATAVSVRGSRSCSTISRSGPASARPSSASITSAAGTRTAPNASDATSPAASAAAAIATTASGAQHGHPLRRNFVRTSRMIRPASVYACSSELPVARYTRPRRTARVVRHAGLLREVAGDAGDVARVAVRHRDDDLGVARDHGLVGDPREAAAAPAGPPVSSRPPACVTTSPPQESGRNAYGVRPTPSSRSTLGRLRIPRRAAWTSALAAGRQRAARRRAADERRRSRASGVGTSATACGSSSLDAHPEPAHRRVAAVPGRRREHDLRIERGELLEVRPVGMRRAGAAGRRPAWTRSGPSAAERVADRDAAARRGRRACWR